MEVPSLARSQKLLEARMEQGGTLASGMSLKLEVSLACLPKGPATWKWVFVMAVPQIYRDKNTADDHEVSEDTDRELQDLARLKVQWASSSGSTSS